jgi:hypothetical protein
LQGNEIAPLNGALFYEIREVRVEGGGEKLIYQLKRRTFKKGHLKKEI